MDSTGITWYRDLIICIWGVLGIFFIIGISILVVAVYKKLQQMLMSVQTATSKCNTILESAEETATDLRSMVQDIKQEVMNPLIQIMAVVHGIRQVLNIFGQFKSKGERTEDG